MLHLNFDDGIDDGGSVKSKFAPVRIVRTPDVERDPPSQPAVAPAIIPWTALRLPTRSIPRPGPRPARRFTRLLHAHPSVVIGCATPTNVPRPQRDPHYKNQKKLCDAPCDIPQAFPSGPRSGHGELPYSPETVKGHFQALRAGLSIYYRGQEGWLADRISPQPADPAYGTVKVRHFPAQFPPF